MHGSAYISGELIRGSVKKIGGKFRFVADDGRVFVRWALYREHDYDSPKRVNYARSIRQESGEYLW